MIPHGWLVDVWCSSPGSGLLGPVRVVSEATNNVKATYLCTTVDHYGSTYGDRGWGCGYRWVLGTVGYHEEFLDVEIFPLNLFIDFTISKLCLAILKV